MGNTGVITRVDRDFDIEVTYPSGNKWTFNPAVLNRVPEPDEIAENCVEHEAFSDSSNDFYKPKSKSLNEDELQTPLSKIFVGDLVQICPDVEKLKLIQRGHGEWADAMLPVS